MVSFVVKTKCPFDPVHQHVGRRLRAVDGGLLGLAEQASWFGPVTRGEALGAQPLHRITSLRVLHVRVANPVLGLDAGVGPLEQILVILAALGDHVTFQGPFNPCPGEGLSLE